MTKRALVLAGGGIAGIAWETGILQGIADEAPEVAAAERNSDVVLGTSAGSAVGAQLGSALSIGELFERQVAAEVLERGEDGWIKLLVRGCIITKDEAAGKTVQTLKAGEQIRRAIKTVLRGKVERLLWDDETARASVLASKPATSRFAAIPKDE